ncbi:MAG: preprotein translocase subunit SecG [Defluviitaleaceae bacterium]|nr:preprotein translocase subunit SecG [Defluviitaleaceae bacterium]
MSAAYIAVSILFMLLCVGLIAVVLMQKKRSAGLGGGMTGAGGQQTYWDKNKGRSLEGNLEKVSKVIGGLIMILALVLCLL